MTGDRLAAPLAALATLLAAWSLSPLVDGRSWQGAAIVMVLLVLLVGVLARALHLPQLLLAPAQLLAGGIGLTAIYAGESAVAGLLPGPSTLARLGQLLADGGDTIGQYAAPVPTSRGITLVLVIGVLVVAVLVDLCVVTLRAPAAAGVPLLTLYAVPAAVVADGLAWRYFVAAAAGWLLLLAHDASERVVRWGRLLPRWGDRYPASRSAVNSDTAALAATGRRLGAAAIVLAVLVPAVIPVADELLAQGSTGTGSGALNGVTVINPVLTLRDNLTPRRDVEVLRYRTSQRDVAPLRIVTADTFDGESWEPGTRDVSRRQRANRGLPTPPGLSPDVSQTEYSMRVEVSGTLNQDFLPVPYPSRRVDINGAWLYDASSLNVIGDGETARGKKYDVTYLAVRPTIDQLRNAPTVPPGTMDRFTTLPRTVPAVVRETARRVTRGQATQYDQAMALQEWFRNAGNFTYSTDAPADSGGDAVADFLSDRKGFCIQFSSAMAVMARSLGIPARIGVGFLPGTPAGENWWSVKLTDAHAWPELYFQGVGWTRFEPTPASRTGAPPSWAQVGAAPSQNPGSSTATASPGATASPSVDPRIGALQAAEERARSGADPAASPVAPVPLGSSRTWQVAGVFLLLLAGVLLTPVSAALGRRRRRSAARDDHERLEANWTDLHERVGDLGIELGDGLTPRQVQTRLAAVASLPDSEHAALSRVALAVERSRYAPPGSPRVAVEGDLRVVLRAVAATRTRGARARALLYPPSGASRLAELGQRVSRRLGGWDQRIAQGSRRLRKTALRWPKLGRRR